MSASNKRPVAGSRSPARSNTSADAARRIRMGLLGSTALIAASLAVSPALAPTTTIANPTGGGTITRTDGTVPTVNDQTAGGGGVEITDVTQGTGITLNGVTINNTVNITGSTALRILGSTGSTGVTLTGVNNLTTTHAGGSALYVESNADLNVGINSSGSTFTGSNGIGLQTLAGNIDFNASGQSQSFVGTGTHIFGFSAYAGGSASIRLGSSTFTGFNTAITSTNLLGSLVEMTGGSINALIYGIRAEATGGANTIQSQAAIVAPTGIYSISTNGATVTTSGGGTINSTVAGTGTGIIATSSDGAGAVNVTVGAAIGGTTRFSTGVNASNSDSSTGAVNVISTAAITAATGIRATGLGAVSVTTSGAGVINGAATGINAVGAISAATVNVNVGAAIGGTTTPAYGVDITSAGGAVTFANSAAITGTTAGLRVNRSAGGVAGTVLVGADIIGGIDLTSGVGLAVTVAQAATVSGTIVSGFGNGALISNNSGGSLTNSGTIITNSATVGVAGVRSLSGGSLINTSTGLISGRIGARIHSSVSGNNAGSIVGTGTDTTEAGLYLNSGGSFTNTGSITGAYAGVQTNSNPLTFNNTGGTITGTVYGMAQASSAVGYYTLTNTGTIETAGGVGGSGISGVLLRTTSTNTNTITNSGSITGGASGYGLEVTDGILSLTNQSGGVVAGGAGGIRVASDDLATLNLNLGSTVNGGILSTGTGDRTTALAGSITGGYDAIGGTGVDTLTITGTGSIGSGVFLGGGNDVISLSAAGSLGGMADLGAGDDTFNWSGGALGGSISGGTGTGDVFNSVLGAGSGSLSLSALASFETYSHQSGTLTLTGSRNGGALWNIATGTTLNLSGSLTNVAGTGFAVTASGTTTVNVLGAGVLDSWIGIYNNGPSTLTATNSGSINGQSTGIFSTSGRVNLTNNVGGTISTSGASGGVAIALAGGGGTIINNGSVTAVTNALTSANTGTGGSASSLTNAGTLEGISAGLVMTGSGAFGVTNTGSINGSAVNTGVGISQSAGTVTIANNSGGTISGNGYAVNTTGGSLALTNASGATLSGGSNGSVQAATGGTATIDLQAGSTTTGDMILSGTGARTVTLAGLFSGNLDATGNSGAVNLSLNTSATGYTLLWAGSGADSLTFNGSGSRTFSVDNLANWETGSFTGGAWTLTGTGNQTSFVSGLSVTGGAALSISNSLQLQGATALTMNNGSIAATASLTNTRTLALTGAGGLGVASGQTLTQSGVISGAGALTLTGPGTLVLSGNNTYTGGTIVNAGILRLNHTSAAGTGLIRMIDPQIDFAATGTYNNNISLEVVNGQQAADPTILNNTSGGLVTLAGRIYETGGVGGANQYVTFNGGVITLTNGANSWGGVTTINSGATLVGTTASISGGSIVNNGGLTYRNASAGTASQAISGSGLINVDGAGAATLNGAITTTGQLSINGANASLILGGARSGANNTGAIIIASGGSLTVADTGSILGGQYNAVRASTAGATVTNFGLIQNAGTLQDGQVGAGVYVQNGGAGGTTTVNNGSITDTGAGSTIQGRNAGVRHESGSTDLLVVNNYGLIVGDLYNGVENTAGGLTVNNFSGGYITAVLGNGVSSASASAVSVTNAGTIGRNIAGNVTVNGYGVVTNGVLTLNNQSGGQIFGTLGGVQINAAGSSITNAGAITGATGGGSAITAAAANLTLTNQAGGSVFGYYGVTMNNGTINNTGLIRGLNDAVLLYGATALTNNAGGLIVGGGTEGVLVNANGSTISNAGLIVNSMVGISANNSVAITNSGVIASGSATDAATTSAHIIRGSSTAIALGAGGSVTNLTGGEILGGSGIVFNNAVSGTVTNAGMIDGSVGYGVTMTGAGTITNQSGGSITGVTGSILLSGAGANTVNLLAGSTTGRIVSLSTGARTVTVAGTMTGDYSAGTGTGVDTVTLASTGSMTSAFLGGGDDSFTWQGGSFSGSIDGGGATDSFTSALGAGSGSIDLGYVTNFETFAHQSGTLTTTGAGTFSGGASVTGGGLIVNGTLNADTSVATGAALSGGGTISGAVSIANGASLSGTQGSTLTMGDLLLGSGSTINATFSGAGGPALFAVTGDLVLDGTVNVASTGAFGFGVYGLMTYGGVLTDNGLLLGTTPGTAQRMAVQTSVAGQVNIVHAPNELLFWDGGNAGQHDNGAINGGAGVWTAAGSNWTGSDGLFNGAMEPQPGFAIFQGAGGTVTVDDSLGAIGVTGMQFAANGYRIEGDSITLANPGTIIRVGDGTAPSAGWSATIASALTGAGGLVKTDLGTLILAGDSDYTGGTTVNAGTLRIGDGATGGSIAGSVVLANNSTLVFSRNDDHDFANAVSGAGSVGVNGAVTLSGAITATGGLDVYSGGEATVSNVNVASGSAVYLATNSLVTVAAGGSVVSQNGTGVESLGSSVYNYGSIQGTTEGVRTTGGAVWNFGAASAISGVTGIYNTTPAFALAVYNAGSVTGSLNALYSAGNLLLNNVASGTIGGQFAVTTLGNLSMANAGTISASVTNFNSSGIYAGGTGAITNTGTITSGTNAIYTQGAGTLTNSGLIQGGGAASTVRLFGANSSVTNLVGGEITTTGTGTGLYLDGLAASVVNSGTIRGGNAVNFISGGGLLTNDGELIGTAASGVLGSSGTVIANLTDGSITGLTNGVRIVTGSGSLTNAGTITGTNGQGVLLQAGGSITNTGSISGGQSGVRSQAALNLSSGGTISGSVNAIESVGTFNDSLTFLAGSTTNGAVLTSGGDDVISLAGTLSGALDAGDGADTVTLIDTASFTSVLDGGDGVDGFVLNGSGSGSLDIGAVLNFESRAKNGAGSWTLTGVDASTAAWTLNAGVLAVSGGSAIDDAAFVNIGAAGTLSLIDDETIGALTGSGFVDLGTSSLTLAGAETTTWDGVIGGSGDLTIGSAYGLTLTGANTSNGFTFVDGVLRLGASGVLADDSVLLINTGGLVDLQGFNETVGGVLVSGVLNGPGMLTADVYLLDGGSVQADLGTGLLVNFDGTSTLSGASNADLVLVDSGTLVLGASNRIVDTADLIVSDGATFDLGSYDETVNVTEIYGTLAGTGTLTAVQHLLDGATVNANLAGGSVYVMGGASTLNGVSNAGLLSVLDGSLTLGASNRIADGATLDVSSGATLNMGAFNESVAVAALAGTLNGTGTLTAGEYHLDGATVNANLGAGNLFNLSGVSTLNGTSEAANVSVQAGTLTLGASDRLSDSAALFVIAGGTFDLGAFNETVDAALLSGTLAGSGTLTADVYQLDSATVNANLGAGELHNLGASTLNGTSGAALVSVQGGTLTLGASNRLSDAATAVVLSGSTLNLGAFNDTVSIAVLNGTLAGTGTLTAVEYALKGATVNANLGAGNLTNVSGVSSLNGVSGAGLVSVQGGTLTLGASNRLADTATVSVRSGATLNVGAFNDTVGLAVVNGTLAGTGTLTAAQYQLDAATVNANLGSGALFNLGGVSTLNGTAAASQVSINAGTLRLGANERLSDAAVVSVASGATFNVNGFNERVGALFGTGDVNVGAGRLTFGGVESGFGGRLSGSGSVVHTGALFTLTGDHTIASISNTGGELRFAGTTTGGLSASGGSVTGAGTIGGALTASNGAILSPGLAGVQNGVGGFTAGGLTLNGGTLAIDVLGKSGGNLVDQLRINGAATLTGGILAPTFQGATSNFDFSTRYLFLQANNLVGTFANGSAFTAATQTGLYWRVRYDLSPNAAVLELRQLTNFDPGASGTGNQRGVGQALSGGQLGASDDWAAVISLIAGLNAADRAAAFDSISGEPLADVTTSMFSANDSFLTAVRDGGLGGRNDGGEALNFVDSLSFSGGRENSADRLGDVLGAFDPSASADRGEGGWVSAYAGDQTLDGKPGQATVESSLNGFAGGYGLRNGSVSLGGAAGVTRLEGDVVARDGHYESDLSHAAGYVAFDDGVWAADVTASFYGGDLDTRRGVSVGAFHGTALGNTHVEGQALSASVARRFQVTDNTMVALGAIGTASNASVDGYTETGAGALSLQASGQERDWQSLQLSARATQDYRVNGQGFRIYGGAGVMAIAGDRQATGDMRFTGAPVGFGTFVVEGAEAPPMAGLADFGVEVGAGEGVTVSAGYRGLFSERLRDNQIGVKLNVSW